MAKPSFREYDDNPRRGDDVKLKGFGVEIEANGRIVILTIIALAALGLVAWHHWTTSNIIVELIRAQEVTTCVLTLNEQERREYRTEGKYCGGSRQRVRFTEDGVTDERRRYVRDVRPK